jgi:hypothetical protein
MLLKDLTKRHPKMLLFGAILLYFIAQSLAWFQINGQFVSPWCKEHPFILSLIGIPISYLFIVATDWTFQALAGSVWPGRLLTFACGIVVFTMLTYLLLGEGLTVKTIISLILTLIIILLQVL